MSDQKWHDIYMEIASKYAEQSKDPRLKVGCLIATQEGILYPGYNGDEIGGSNVPDSLDPGQSGFIHAEANALIKFNPTIHKNSTMYITNSPCPTCARMIINTRSISEVYYSAEYRVIKGIEILQKANIKCVKI